MFGCCSEQIQKVGSFDVQLEWFNEKSCLESFTWWQYIRWFNNTFCR